MTDKDGQRTVKTVTTPPLVMHYLIWARGPLNSVCGPVRAVKQALTRKIEFTPVQTGATRPQKLNTLHVMTHQPMKIFDFRG